MINISPEARSQTHLSEWSLLLRSKKRLVAPKDTDPAKANAAVLYVGDSRQTG